MTAFNTLAEMRAALKLCKGGETLEMAPGLTLAGERMNGIRNYFTAPVTIKGNGCKILGSWQIEDHEKVIFTGFVFGVPNATADYTWCVRHYRCKAVDFIGNEFFGRVVEATETASDFRMGFGIMGVAPGSRLIGNRFHDLSRAATLGGVGATVHENDVTQCSEGFQCSNLKQGEFKRNAFLDFRPKSGDHPDAIQIHGSTSANSSQDIVTEDNLFSSILGRGMQGFFVRNEWKHARLTDPTEPFHERIAARKNLVIGGYWNSLFVQDTIDTLIEDNEVYTIVDRAINKNLINVDSGTGIVRRNKAIAFTGGATGYTKTDNTIIPAITLEQAKSLEAAWLAKFRSTGGSAGEPAGEDPHIAVIAELEADIDVLNTQIASLGSTIASKDAALAETQADLVQVKAALAEEQQSTTLLTDKAASLQTTIDGLRGAIEQAGAILDKAA